MVGRASHPPLPSLSIVFYFLVNYYASAQNSSCFARKIYFLFYGLSQAPFLFKNGVGESLRFLCLNSSNSSSRD